MNAHAHRSPELLCHEAFEPIHVDTRTNGVLHTPAAGTAPGGPTRQQRQQQPRQPRQQRQGSSALASPRATQPPASVASPLRFGAAGGAASGATGGGSGAVAPSGSRRALLGAPSARALRRALGSISSRSKRLTLEGYVEPSAPSLLHPAGGPLAGASPRATAGGGGGRGLGTTGGYFSMLSSESGEVGGGGYAAGLAGGLLAAFGGGGLGAGGGSARSRSSRPHSGAAKRLFRQLFTGGQAAKGASTSGGGGGVDEEAAETAAMFAAAAALPDSEPTSPRRHTLSPELTALPSVAEGIGRAGLAAAHDARDGAGGSSYTAGASGIGPTDGVLPAQQLRPPASPSPQQAPGSGVASASVALASKPPSGDVGELLLPAVAAAELELAAAAASAAAAPGLASGTQPAAAVGPDPHVDIPTASMRSSGRLTTAASGPISAATGSAAAAAAGDAAALSRDPLPTGEGAAAAQAAAAGLTSATSKQAQTPAGAVQRQQQGSQQGLVGVSTLFRGPRTKAAVDVGPLGTELCRATGRLLYRGRIAKQVCGCGRVLRVCGCRRVLRVCLCALQVCLCGCVYGYVCLRVRCVCIWSVGVCVRFDGGAGDVAIADCCGPGR